LSFGFGLALGIFNLTFYEFTPWREVAPNPTATLLLPHHYTAASQKTLSMID